MQLSRLALVVVALLTTACQQASMAEHAVTMHTGAAAIAQPHAGIAVMGSVTAPANIVGQGGGNIIAQGGGNFVGHNGSAIVGQGGGNYGLLQAAARPLAGVKVFLADAAGKAIPGMATATTDAHGAYSIHNVPADFSYLVIATIDLADGKQARLSTLARPGQGNTTANIDGVTTLAASAVTDGLQDLGSYTPSTFAHAVDLMRAHATPDLLPDWTDATAVQARVTALEGDVTELKAAVTEMRTDIQRLNDQIDTLKQAVQIAQQAPSSATPTPVTSPSGPAAPTATPSASPSTAPATTPTPSSTPPATTPTASPSTSPTPSPSTAATPTPAALPAIFPIFDDFMRGHPTNSPWRFGAYVNSALAEGTFTPSTEGGTWDSKVGTDEQWFSGNNTSKNLTYRYLATSGKLEGLVDWLAPMAGNVTISCTLTSLMQLDGPLTVGIYRADMLGGTPTFVHNTQQILPMAAGSMVKVDFPSQSAVTGNKFALDLRPTGTDGKAHYVAITLTYTVAP